MFTNFLLAAGMGAQLDSAFYGMDMAIFSFFGNLQNEFLTVIAKIFTALGSPQYSILIFILGLVLCFFKRTRKAGFAVVFAFIIGTLITNIIVKPTVMRIRPYNTLQNDLQYWAWYVGAGQLCESDFCFPSGHTTAAVEIATALFPIFYQERKRVFAWLMAVGALLTAMSRIYLMVHYPSDVIFGLIVGLIAGFLGYLLSSVVTKAVRRRKIDDLVDLGRLFKKGISKRAGGLILLVVWVVIFGISFLLTFNEGGPDTIRCAYDREYDCQNEAEVGSKKYPPINGQCYCKIHWKQLNEQFEQTGSVDSPDSDTAALSTAAEPVVNSDIFTFYNDPAIAAFRDNFDTNTPVKMKYSKSGGEVIVTDPALIRQVFEALKGVQVGEPIEGAAGTETDQSIYYTFYLPDESTVTVGIAYPYAVLYNGTYYNVNEANGAFEIVPDDYHEATEQEAA